jgi:proteic killer suppression protein
MIQRFRHDGLQRFFEQGSKAGIPARHAEKLKLILTLLQAASTPQDMNFPGSRLHELKGSRRGTWSVDVTGNWRVTFRFDGNDATNVNYEDTHGGKG